MIRTKIKQKCERVLAMALTVLLTASVFIAGFGIETLAAGVAALTAASSTPITSIELKVTPLNSKTTDTYFTNKEVRAYPQNGKDGFRVSIIVNGKDYGDSAFSDGIVLPSDITFSYRTYDLSAIASTGDYTAISGTHTFTKGSNESHYDFSVVVTATDYGLYHNRDVTSKTYRKIDWNSSSIGELYTTEVYGNQAPSDTAYNARSFGFEIYDVQGATVYHTADKSTGKNVYYDHAIGTLPVKHYEPYSWISDGWQLFWYGTEAIFSLSDVSMPRDSVDTSKAYINTALGIRFAADVIDTGLGHYYFSGYGTHNGPDASQRDSYAGLTYEGYEKATSINDKDLMLKWKMGVVMYEMDGYPSNEDINFSAYGEKSIYGSDYSELETGENTYQFEKYRTVVKDRDVESGTCYAYKIEGSPTWIGMTGQREKYGEDRKIKNAKLRLYFRDDSPVEIKGLYIEDTSKVTKTQDDTLRIMVRFNEPMQLASNNLPELVCALNNVNLTSATATNAVKFKYEYGNGTDTWVFSYELKNLPSTAVVTQVQVYYMTYADQVVDFSSTEEIHVTSKKSNSSTVTAGVSKSNDIITKEKGTRWSVAKSYGGLTSGAKNVTALIGPVTLKLTKSIDPRTPTISDIKDSLSGKTAKNHTAQIMLNENGLDVAVYAHWTEDMNGVADTEIPRPTSYTENERIVATNSTARTYNATASLEGTVYLWVKAVTAFGKVDERLCGPFYFDKSPEAVTNIQVQSGTPTLASQSKTKYIEFTVDHTGDYLSCSGDNIFDSAKHSETVYSENNILINSLSLVYGTESVWGSSSQLTTKNLYNGKTNSRGLKALVVATKEDYVYQFKFSSKNLTEDKTVQTTDLFIAKDSSNADKKATYITKVTYRIEIGYQSGGFNDFDLSVGDVEYKKVFFGFQTTDEAGNTKEPTSAAFTAGKDYLSDQYAFFDTRDIKDATVSYPQSNQKEYNVLCDTKTGQSIDETINVFGAGKSFNVKYTFPSNYIILLSELKTAGYQVKVHIKKPNSTITADSTTDCETHKLSSWGKTVKTKVTVKEGEVQKEVEVDKQGAFVSNAASLLDASDNPVTQYTSWFSWKLAGKGTNASGTYFDTIELTSYTQADVKDLCGYYEIYFSFDNGNEIKYTPSATFYIGNGENETANIEALNDGKVFINKVFRLPAETCYYQQLEDGNYAKNYYATVDSSIVNVPGSLTFSSEEIARKYLLFKEYQDLYLYQIPKQDIADSLNQKNGGMRSETDVSQGRTAAVGQWWIRYKIKTWAPGNTSSTSWIYYYFSDGSVTPTIDIDNLRPDLYNAIQSVVDTIKQTGETVVLTGEDNLNKYGNPSIPVSCVRYEPISDVTKSNCGSLYTKSISFQGDTAIYDATVLFTEQTVKKDAGGNVIRDWEGNPVYVDVTNEYKLASTSLLNVGDNTNVYISAYDGDYAGVWGKVPSGDNILVKEAINSVYRQILLSVGKDEKTVSNTTAPSGRYTVLEVDENGYAFTYVYIDKDAPQLNFEYSVYNENGKTVPATKYFTTGSEGGLAIHAVSFTLRGIGTYGVVGNSTANEEVDKYAYVVVFRNNSFTPIYAMTVDDLRLENPVIKEEGTYTVEVWDRSGNNYSFTVEIVSKAMTVTATPEDNGVVVKVNFRDENQISVYEIKRNGITIDTKYAKSKTFSENGIYSIHVVDRFGVEFLLEGIQYSREIPPITWKTTGEERTVGDGSTPPVGLEYSSYAKLIAVDSVTYNVVTSVPLSFSFATAAGIKYELLSGLEEEDFIKSTSGLNNTAVTQKELGNFQVKLSYVSHPNVYVIYNVIVDTVSPIIEVEYDQYSFESRAQLDAMLSFLELGDDYESGDVITPTRIDFSMLSSSTLRVPSGASIFTSEARLTLRDNSGISRLKIELDKKVIYDGEYREDGDYETADGTVNFNHLSEYGQYTITAFDILGNRSVFTFSNTPSNEVVYAVDGQTVEPTYDYIYETDAAGRIILDQNGDPIVKEKWLFLLKFEERKFTSVKVDFNGETVYEGKYDVSDALVGDVNTFFVHSDLFTQNGVYVITVTDNCGAESVIRFYYETDDVRYYVDGVKDDTGALRRYASSIQTTKDKGDDGLSVSNTWFAFTDLDPAYQDRSTKFSTGNYYRDSQNFTYTQYGNKSQSVTISRDSDIQILLSYQDEVRVQEDGVEKLKPVTGYRFIGLRIEDDGIYLYRYAIDETSVVVYETYQAGDVIPEGYYVGDYKLDAEGQMIPKTVVNVSVGEDVEPVAVFTFQEAVKDSPKVIYHFDNDIESGMDKLGMYITATWNKNGTVTILLNAPTDASAVVTSEMKVTQTEGSFESSYYKTVLSLYQSSVELENENGPIEIKEEEMGVGQWKYANGNKLSVNLDSIDDPYITAVLISYSKTMTPGQYHYLYSVDPTVTVEPYYGEGDGYYFVKTVNVFGNEKVYRLAVSNSLLVSTVAEYLDGWQRQFATSEVCDINANKLVTVAFRDDSSITFKVYRGGVIFSPKTEEKNGAVTLIFDEKGDYTVVISDQYGNVVTRQISILGQSLKLPSNIILNEQTNALRYTENYSKEKVSINSTLLDQYDIAYIAIEKSGAQTLVLLDEISASEDRVAEVDGVYQRCVGLAGDGVYTVVFRDSHGNRAAVTVHYRETPTLNLSRMTSLSEKAEAFSLEDAQNPEINFISNSSLYFTTDAEQYIFTVDGQISTCPRTISFVNSEAKGRVAYEIEYLDEYGFSYHFTAVLYRTDIQLELDPSVSSVNVNGVLMTNENIRVVYTEGASCFYQTEGGEYIEFPEGGALKKDGNYVIFAHDIAGNYNYFTITKDSVVSYSFREGRYGKKIENGMVTNSDNVLFQEENGDSATIKVAFLNGVKVGEGDGFNFQQNGKWEVVITDKAGNESLFSFYVYTHEINRLDFYEPQDYSFTDIWYTATGSGRVSMNSSVINEDGGVNHFVFDKAGTYTIVMNSDLTGALTTFTLDISETLPTATLNGVENGGATIESVLIANTKKDDKVYVYHNGSSKPTVYEIAYDGEKVEISDEGEYVVVVKNRAENEVSFAFTKKHVANTAGSVLIIFMMVVIVAGLFAGMTYRNKSRVDK